MFARIGQIVVRHPWLTIVTWIVATVIIVMSAPALKATSDQADFLPSHYESARAGVLAEKAFPQAKDPAALMVFMRNDEGALTTEEQDRVGKIVEQLARNKYADVGSITSSADQISPNQEIMLGAVFPRANSPEVLEGEKLTDSVIQLRSDAVPLLEGTGLRMRVTGEIAQQIDSEEASGDIDQLIMVATIGLIVLLMLVIFRSILLAILPVVTILVATMASSGLIGYASEAFDLKTDQSIQSLLIVVLFGVGADYFLFLVFRYRERLRAGVDPQQAMIESVARVGEAITSAAGAVIVAFMALSLSTLGQLRAWGPALAIAVAVTLVAALTLVPAMLSLLGQKVFWPSRSFRKAPAERVSGAIGRLVGRAPAAVAAVSGLVMVSLAVFAFGFAPQFDQTASGPQNLESVLAQKDLERGFSAGQSQPAQILLTRTDGKKYDNRELTAFTRELEKVEGVGQVLPPTTNPSGDTVLISTVLDFTPTSDAAIELAGDKLRDAAHDAAPAGSRAYVGGLSSVLADVQTAVNHDYKVVFPVAGLAILIILSLLLRSLVAPWYLMASVALGFAASLGSTVLVFQHLQGQSGLVFSLPILMYLFVVAIGTDYNILMVARLREEARAGHAPREAASQAVRHTAPTIAAAGVILAGTFSVLMLADDASLQQMGFGISAGIIIVAFVMSMLLTPALTALMGHRAWWPGHRDEPAAASSTDQTDRVPVG